MALIARLTKEDREAMSAEQAEMYENRAQQTQQEAYTAATTRLENGEPNAMSPGAIKAAANRDGVEVVEEADVPAKKGRGKDKARESDYSIPTGKRGSRRPAGESIGSETAPGASTQTAAESDEDEEEAPSSEAEGLGGEGETGGTPRSGDYGISH